MPRAHTLRPARLEAFSDGVIAVIITIMVLELKVPASDGLRGIHDVLPILFVYLLSFVQTGIYWVNHHYLIDEVRDVGHGLLWANLALLFCLSLIPFATIWVAEKHHSPDSISIYAATCLLPAVAYTVLGRFVRRHSDHHPHASLGKQLFSCALYLLAIGIAHFNVNIALGCIATVAVLWLMPPRAHEEDVHAGSTGPRSHLETE